MNYTLEAARVTLQGWVCRFWPNLSQAQRSRRRIRANASNDELLSVALMISLKNASPTAPARRRSWQSNFRLSPVRQEIFSAQRSDESQDSARPLAQAARAPLGKILTTRVLRLISW